MREQCVPGALPPSASARDEATVLANSSDNCIIMHGYMYMKCQKNELGRHYYYGIGKLE